MERPADPPLGALRVEPVRLREGVGVDRDRRVHALFVQSDAKQVRLDQLPRRDPPLLHRPLHLGDGRLDHVESLLPVLDRARGEEPRQEDRGKHEGRTRSHVRPRCRHRQRSRSQVVSPVSAAGSGRRDAAGSTNREQPDYRGLQPSTGTGGGACRIRETRAPGYCRGSRLKGPAPPTRPSGGVGTRSRRYGPAKRDDARFLTCPQPAAVPTRPAGATPDAALQSQSDAPLPAAVLTTPAGTARELRGRQRAAG